MLVKRFYVKDIKTFEEDSDISIIKLFESYSISNLISLVSLGNGNCSEEHASELIDTYLLNNDLIDAYSIVKICLLGNTEQEAENRDTVPANKYNNMTDIYSEMCMQLMSMGVTYSEFWSMTTKDIYKVFDSITTKVIQDTNKQLMIAHEQARMTGLAVWGNLEKDAPKVGAANKENDMVTLKGIGTVTKQHASNIINLMAIKNRKKVK